MEKEIQSLSRSYQTGLERYLLRCQESTPVPLSTHRIGNRAVKLGVDLLGIAKIHENALATLKTEGISKKAMSDRDRRSTAFFDSVVAPIEESRFNVSEANNRLKAIIKTLTDRTKDLDLSNQKLLEEITRRKEVEKSLRTSEESASQLLKKARKMETELRSLSRGIITAQESERGRISRELHDVIAQTLAGINVRLAVLRSQGMANTEKFLEKIETTERLVEQSVEIVHRFASDLRPVALDDIGLIPALNTYIRSFAGNYGIPVKQFTSPKVEELDTSALTALFRIAQEALINVARHSKASQVKFDIRPTRKSFRMTISDDGRGFAMNEANSANQNQQLGILGMRERAEMVGGSFRIDSAVGGGTVIRVEIPRPALLSKTETRSPKTAKKPK